MYGLIATFTLFVSDTCYKFQCRGIKKTSVRLLVLGYIYFAMGGCNSIGFTGKVSGCAVACPVSDTSTMDYLPVLLLGKLLYYSFGSIINYVNAILIGCNIFRFESRFREASGTSDHFNDTDNGVPSAMFSLSSTG